MKNFLVLTALLWGGANYAQASDPVHFGKQSVSVAKTYSEPIGDGRYRIIQNEEVCLLKDQILPVYDYRDLGDDDVIANPDPMYNINCTTEIDGHEFEVTFMGYSAISYMVSPFESELIDFKAFFGMLFVLPSDWNTNPDTYFSASNFAATRDLNLESIFLSARSDSDYYSSCEVPLPPSADNADMPKNNDEPDCISDHPIDVIFDVFVEMKELN